MQYVDLAYLHVHGDVRAHHHGFHARRDFHVMHVAHGLHHARRGFHVTHVALVFIMLVVVFM